LHLDAAGIQPMPWSDLTMVTDWKSFFADPERTMGDLVGPDAHTSPAGGCRTGSPGAGFVAHNLP
jgi:hypothetical protein